ncbi:MAG: aminotransferase class V-fold PLP-dependent enzyme [Chitinophagales bacterium]|nr:aminotransferase class V-fold PLP-dependent enzyme [Chitinophagales bacterium]
MPTRRSFLKNSTALISLSAMPEMAVNASVQHELQRVKNLSSQQIASDEDFWMAIKDAYTASATIINLNNGGVSPSPKVVQDALDRYNKMCNEAPSYFMWQILDKGRENLRGKLADIAGCNIDEIAINRNTTEGLDTIIFGLDLQGGDEIILTKQDYPNMINAWKQREKRDGIILKWIDLELPGEDENYFRQKYTEQITAKTKLVQVNHLINWTGHINPVKKIADAIHEKGVDVMIDGAHTFGHFNFTIPELGGDYYATSLHKWLSAPFGSGMLWIKKEKIKNIWPLFAAPEDKDINDIRKFEHMGTRSFPIEYAIGNAVDFHLMIGADRKEARLRYLKNYWVEKVKDLPKFKLNTSLHPDYSCAIANFRIEDMKPEDIVSKLFSTYSIHTVGINWENIHGVRVAPHVYTSIRELDLLVKAIKEIAI